MVELSLPARPDTGDNARDLRLRSARREVTERRRITQRLREALSTDGFNMGYQPIINLNSGFITGAESLIRLTHARRGLIHAVHFMPVAERSDIIVEVAGWIIALSARHLQSGRLMRQVLDALSRSGIAPERLEFELTEAMLIDQNDDMVFALRALHGIGVRLALNNFGTGYAALGALKRLPLSTLRLDRTLLPGTAEDRAQTAILNAAIATGHALDGTILAEGVETEAQLIQLRQLGCDEAQGPYFSQPVEAADIRAMLGTT
jgi:EAL domain-containing protein (putative c-di-GMP-specific phosphodiesterase class I)